MSGIGATMGIRLLSILLLAFFISHEAVSIQSAVSDTKEKTLPSLVGIAHVAFRVSDVAKSRAFYQKLGFEQSFEFNDLGNPPVSYIKVNDHQFIELYQRKDDSQPIGLMHLCYETNDIETPWMIYQVHSGLLLPTLIEFQPMNSLGEIDDALDRSKKGRHVPGEGRPLPNPEWMKDSELSIEIQIYDLSLPMSHLSEQAAAVAATPRHPDCGQNAEAAVRSGQCPMARSSCFVRIPLQRAAAATVDAESHCE